MELKTLLLKKIKSGRIFAIEAETAGGGNGIRYIKHTTLTAQYGVNYAHVAAVRDKLAGRGVGAAWFEHTQHRSIVRSKEDPAKLYLQIMNPRNIRTRYTLADGTPVTKSALVAAGAVKDGENNAEKSVTLVYALENIIKINYKGVAA